MNITGSRIRPFCEGCRLIRKDGRVMLRHYGEARCLLGK